LHLRIAKITPRSPGSQGLREVTQIDRGGLSNLDLTSEYKFPAKTRPDQASFYRHCSEANRPCLLSTLIAALR
jgi:hypothetical protein